MWVKSRKNGYCINRLRNIWEYAENYAEIFQNYAEIISSNESANLYKENQYRDVWWGKKEGQEQPSDSDHLQSAGST